MPSRYVAFIFAGRHRDRPLRRRYKACSIIEIFNNNIGFRLYSRVTLDNIYIFLTFFIIYFLYYLLSYFLSYLGLNSTERLFWLFLLFRLFFITC